MLRTLERTNWVGPYETSSGNHYAVRYVKIDGDGFIRKVELRLGKKFRVIAGLTRKTSQGKIPLAGSVTYCTDKQISNTVDAAVGQLEAALLEPQFLGLSFAQALSFGNWQKMGSSKEVYRRQTRLDGLVEEIEIRSEDSSIEVNSAILKTTDIYSGFSSIEYAAWRHMSSPLHVASQVIEQTMLLNHRAMHNPHGYN
ncbi:hypothetical protein HOC01_04910 [archaeon]|jgi:hypothetical protein|nr:hypothetical protein [archaeon]MBT6698308.1 hypothetical protein [archaeon]